MEVSMNGLRNHLLANYNSLVRNLNSNIKDKSWDPHVVVDVDAIQRQLESIRSCIVTLAFSYIEGEDGFQAMDDETKFERFNPEEDEDDN